MKLTPLLREFAREIKRKCNGNEMTAWASEHGQTYCICYQRINHCTWQYSFEVVNGDEQTGTINIFIDENDDLTYRVTDINDFTDELYTLKTLKFVKSSEFFADVE